MRKYAHMAQRVNAAYARRNASPAPAAGTSDPRGTAGEA